MFPAPTFRYLVPPSLEEDNPSNEYRHATRLLRQRRSYAFSCDVTTDQAIRNNILTSIVINTLRLKLIKIY